MLRNYGLEWMKQKETLLKGLLSDVVYFGDISHTGSGLCKEKQYGDMVATVAYREVPKEDVLEIYDYAFWHNSSNFWEVEGYGTKSLMQQKREQYMLCLCQGESKLAVRWFAGSPMERCHMTVQVLAYPLSIDYYQEKTGRQKETILLPLGRMCAAKQREKPHQKEQIDGKKGAVAAKPILPDNAILLKGKVVQWQQKKVVLGDNRLIVPYICCVVETVFGPLELIHTQNEVRHGARVEMKVGATIFAKCVLEGRLIKK